MSESAPLLALADRMLWITALVGAPVLLACLAVGLVISLLQAATSVNEQSLTFIPKLMITALVLVIFGGSMIGLICDFATDIFAQIAAIGHGAGSGTT